MVGLYVCLVTQVQPISIPVQKCGGENHQFSTVYIDKIVLLWFLAMRSLAPKTDTYLFISQACQVLKGEAKVNLTRHALFGASHR